MLFFFFFNDTATTEIYTLSLHDALPIWIIFCRRLSARFIRDGERRTSRFLLSVRWRPSCSPRTNSEIRCERLTRSEEHTSELQSQSNLVCRLLLEKKENKSDGLSNCFTH